MDDSALKISVVLLTFNQREFVEQALQSILDQEVPIGFEVVVADDFSQDGTREILESIAARDDRVRLLASEANLGMQRNLRRAVSAAQGCYVALLEGDDYWSDRSKLRRQCAQLDEAPDLAAVGHLTEILDTTGEDQSHGYNLVQEGWQGRSVLRLEEVLHGSFPHFSSLMYRKSTLATTPLWFDRLRIADWPMCLLIAMHGPIEVIREPMSVYRKNSLSSWTPRPVSERRRIALDDAVEISTMCPELAPKLLPFVAELHIRIASHALHSGERLLAVVHLVKAFRIRPTVPLHQVRRTVKTRARAICARGHVR